MADSIVETRPPAAGGIVVRSSTEADVAAMVAIYDHHVSHGLGTFDPEPLHDDDIKRRRKNMMKRRLPHLVAEHDGKIVGYAYAVPFRKRPAYRHAVKHSIYVHPDHLKAGIGRLLLPALIEACRSAMSMPRTYRRRSCTRISAFAALACSKASASSSAAGPTRF